MRSAWTKKKYQLTVASFVCGTGIAFYTMSSLSEYTMFVTAILAVFGAADVTDKKLNPDHQ